MRIAIVLTTIATVLQFGLGNMSSASMELKEVFPGTCKYKKKDKCIVGHRAYRNREWVSGDSDLLEIAN